VPLYRGPVCADYGADVTGLKRLAGDGCTEWRNPRSRAGPAIAPRPAPESTGSAKAEEAVTCNSTLEQNLRPVEGLQNVKTSN
jgi:hypothetical protein